MKLEYNILWFEDDEVWYESIIGEVKEHLVKKAFIPCIAWKKSDDLGKDLKSFLDQGEFDLILMDYNLPGVLGDEIIGRIRHFSLGVEIIFYSADGAQKIRTELFKKRIDGVYCTNRDEVYDTVPQIIDATLKKVEDLNSVRGLVIAEASDQDGLIKETLKTYWEGDVNAEEKQELWGYVEKSIIDKTHKDDKKKIEKLKKDPNLATFLDGYLCDASKRARILHWLGKKLDIGLDETFLVDYQEKVLKKRNLLAHVKPTHLGGKKVLVGFDGKEEITVDEDFFQTVREDLAEYREILEKSQKKF